MSTSRGKLQGFLPWRELQGINEHHRQIKTPRDDTLALAFELVGKQVGRVWAPPVVPLVEENRGEFNVGGVALSPAHTVDSLVVHTRPVIGVTVDVELEAEHPQLAGGCGEVATRTAIVIHMSDRRALVSL